MSRSPKPKIAKPGRAKKTVLVATHVTPEVARMLAERCAVSGDLQAAYVRRLIHLDLGLTYKDDTHG